MAGEESWGWWWWWRKRTGWKKEGDAGESLGPYFIKTK